MQLLLIFLLPPCYLPSSSPLCELKVTEFISSLHQQQQQKEKEMKEKNEVGKRVATLHLDLTAFCG